MAAINPRAVNSGKGQHPDIDPNSGDLRPEALVWASAEERDFNRKFKEDAVWAGTFMERVAERQRQEPEWIQNEVAGVTFGEGRGPYAGHTEYQQKLAELRAEEDRYRYGAGTIVVRDTELEDMSMSRYEELFDDNGRPKPGVTVVHTSRSVRLDEGIDPHSARELGNR